MAFHGYVHFEDADKGSQIKGTSEKKETCNDGKTTEAMCLVQSAQHILRMPYNEQNGRPTAEAVHFPYQLTINMDRATPELYKHMVEKRPLNVTIYFFGSSPENPETHNWFTISCRQPILRSTQHSPVRPVSHRVSLTWPMLAQP